MTKLLHYGIDLARMAIEGQQQKKCPGDDNSNDIRDPSLRKYVVASSGCYGAALANGAEYTGDYPGMTIQTLKDFHRKKAKALWDHRPDGLAIETIPTVDECQAVCEMLREIQQEEQEETGESNNTDDGGDGSKCCCWISLACRNETELNNGQSLADALHVIQEVDPEAKFVHGIGLNCCDSANISSLVQILTSTMAAHQIADRAASEWGGRQRRRAIIIYPNSGEEWDAGKSTWKDNTGCTSSDDFAARLMEAVDVVETTWKESYAQIVDNLSFIPSRPRLVMGGCCRTRPETIMALRKLVDDRHQALDSTTTSEKATR